jgi:hypothetical protein
MAAVGAALRAAGVRRIYLAHGTSAGTDPLGVASTIARLSPALRQIVESTTKGLVDAVLEERGNFSSRFAELLERSLNADIPGSTPENGSTQQPRHASESSIARGPIEVRRFLWSGENHHLGRADAAVRWIDELVRDPLPAGERLMLVGHSHAGNVLAILTQLISGQIERVARFFDAARVFFRARGALLPGVPPWERIERLLHDRPRPLNNTPLDIVTLATPVRYGWDLQGDMRLLHFVFHYRHAAASEEHTAIFPPRLGSWPHLTNGDFTQQIGIAGTNFAPPLPFGPAWQADRRLARLLEGDLEPANTWKRWKQGRRVADAGTTLLIDYGLRFNQVLKWTASHTFYTHTEWMVWQFEEIVRRWYRETTGGDNVSH